MIMVGSLLYRTGDNSNKYQIIKLEGAQVTVGSSLFETFAIPSTVISPRHAALRQYDNSWFIEDTYSMRGVIVNGQRLTPNTPRILRNGDLVQFGVAITDEDPLFLYKFLSAAEIKVDRMGNVSVENTIPFPQNGEIDQARGDEPQEDDAAVNELNNIKQGLINLHEQFEHSMDLFTKALDKSKEELYNLAIKSYGKSYVLKQQIANQKIKEASVIRDIMDVKLQCSICLEYFIQATALNCTHVFCSFCINKWMSLKESCPNCRKTITYQVQIPALDLCINNMVDQLGHDMKMDRAEVLKQRGAEQAAFKGGVENITIRKLLIVAKDKGTELLVALIRTAERTRDLGYTGAGIIRKVVEHPETHLQTFRRAAELQGAGALAKAATFKRALEQKAGEAIKKAAILKREEALARAKAAKKAALLMRAGARKGKKMIDLTKNAAYNGARVVKSSDMYKNISDVLSKFVKKGLDINDAVVMKVASALRRSAFLKTSLLAKAKVAHKAVMVMKRAALVKAADVKRRAAIIRASAMARASTLAGKVIEAAASTKQAAVNMAAAAAARNTAVDLLESAVLYISNDSVKYNCSVTCQSGRYNLFYMVAQ